MRGVERAGRARGGERRPRRRRSPDVAAVLAILVPGLGHLYAGRLRAGVLWLVAILLGYWAVLLPGVVLHVLSIGSAQRAAGAVDGPHPDGRRGESVEGPGA